jgi:hypothetical protein
MAIAKLENMERTDFANRLQTGGPGMMKKDIK